MYVKKGKISDVHPTDLWTLEELVRYQRTSGNSIDLLGVGDYVTANLALFRERDGLMEYGVGGKIAFQALANEKTKFWQKYAFQGLYYPEKGELPDPEIWIHDTVWVDPQALCLTQQACLSDTLESTISLDAHDYWGTQLNDSKKIIAQKLFGSLEAKEDEFGMLRCEYGENMNALHVLTARYIWTYMMPVPVAKIRVKEKELMARPVYISMSSNVCQLSLGNRVDNYEYRFVCGQ